jgi:hypothetical protein
MERSPEESYKEGRLSGMFEAYGVFDSVLGRLKDSLDNVWMIHDQADWYTGDNAVKDKEKLVFAINTLLVLRESFQGKYDDAIDEIKVGMEEYRDEI